MSYIRPKAENANPWDAVRPIAVYGYTDMIQLWVDHLEEIERANLRANTAHAHIERRKCPFSSKYHWRIQLTRPNETALRILQGKKYCINQVEEALDLIFETEEELKQATKIFNETNVKKYHRHQQLRFEGSGRYTSKKRKVANNLLSYDDKISRTTGELFCLHIEWRMKRTGLIQAKLTEIEEIINLERLTFWKQRLVFKSVDHEKLGRLFTKSKDREANRRRGREMMETLEDTQTLIDTYGHKRDLRSCLRELEFIFANISSKVEISQGGWRSFMQTCAHKHITDGETRPRVRVKPRTVSDHTQRMKDR
jgi:hypothetical protein